MVNLLVDNIFSILIIRYNRIPYKFYTHVAMWHLGESSHSALLGALPHDVEVHAASHVRIAVPVGNCVG